MIRFGVAGNSNSFYSEGFSRTVEAAAWCKRKGIDCFEYSFGKGVKMNADTAKQIGNAFRDNDVALSAHAPYYINFSNPDPQKIENSIGYVMQTLHKLSEFGYGERIVVHPATQGKMPRNEAVDTCRKNLESLAAVVADNGFSEKKVCLETMGKTAQIGTVEEIVSFCEIAPFFYPCIDFGHVNARTLGSLRGYDDYKAVVDYMAERLADNKVKYMHVHFSKIMYGPCGEIKHLTFDDTEYGPEFDPLAKLFADYGLEPTIICESDGTQAEDAIRMKEMYTQHLLR